MTAEFESMAGWLLVILVVLCLVQLAFTGLLLWYLKRMTDSLRGGLVAGPLSAAAPAAAATSMPTPAPEPIPAGEAPPVPPEVPPATPMGPAEPAREDTDVIGDSPDIQESIRRLSGKHLLEDVIFATRDGLVIVSLSPGSSDEAARFSDLHRRRKKPDVPGVTFLELVHRGEPVLAILRSDRPLTPEQLKAVDGDARRILNWWL